jgi:NADH dehydrogenase
MPRVVIVGAGFGGLACARALARHPVETLLIDRNNYHLFTPLLYQVASSLLNPSDIAYPVRTALRPAANAAFRMAEIVEILPTERLVVTASGETIVYDWLVLATGADNNFFGMTAVERRAHSLNTLPNALNLRDHVLRSFERAVMEPDHAAEHLTVVIVGGGPTGVEYAGALAELVPLMRRDFASLRHSPIRIVLLEARDALLGAFDQSLGRHAADRLERLGVEVRLGDRLDRVEANAITLASGIAIPTRSLVWAAGVRPTLPAVTPFPTATPGGRLVVGPDLRIPGQERIFAIGDVAACPRGPGLGEMPMLSAPAIQAGRYVARAILSLDRGQQPAPFRYLDKGIMAVIGRNAAVAQVGPLKMKGLLGWLAWLMVHLYFLIGFRNRFAVLLRWGWNYLFYDRPIRFIIPGLKRGEE